MMRTWRVWTLDTWGNAADGWTVNDRREYGSVSFDDDGTEDTDVLASLASIGLKMLVPCDIEWDWGPDSNIVLAVDSAEDGEPLLTLESDK